MPFVGMVLESQPQWKVRPSSCAEAVLRTKYRLGHQDKCSGDAA